MQNTPSGVTVPGNTPKHPLTSRKLLVALLGIASTAFASTHPALAHATGWIAGMTISYIAGESLVDIARANIDRLIPLLPPQYQEAAHEAELLIERDLGTTTDATPSNALIAAGMADESTSAPQETTWRTAAASERAAQAAKQEGAI